MILRLVYFLCLWRYVISEWYNDADRFPDADVGEDSCAHVGGGVDKAVCSTIGASVKVLYSTWTPRETTAWTITATLSPPCSGCDYGQQVDVIGDDVTGNLLFVSAINQTTLDGEVYFYRGSWSQWSTFQILTPRIGPKIEFQDDIKNKFGMQMDADRKTNRRLYVGCENCNVTNNYNNFPSGAVFAYETSPNAKEMRPAGVLTSSNIKYSHIGKNFLSAYGDLVTTSVSYENTYTDALVFDKGPEGEYPQRLHGRNGYAIASADVYDDTIVLGVPSASVDASANAGEVYVVYPYKVPGHRRLHDTEEGSETYEDTNSTSMSIANETETETASANGTDSASNPSPKPKPPPRTVWSYGQILRASTPEANMFYGSSVAIEGNTMFIGTLDSEIYVLERESSRGQWSQQQILVSSESENVAIDNGLLFAYSDSTLNISSYSPDSDWNCLVVEVMDQFGDGWDSAMLHIEAPDKSIQRFAPYCGETPSPLSFRYCPPSLDDSVGGIYKLYIHDAPKAKFNWEILWRVYREVGYIGEWFTGNSETKMDFFFDVPEASFQERKLEKLQLNSTCSECPSEAPKPKPKPKARALKGDTTSSPTIEYTLHASSDILTVETTGTEWFRENYLGTEYYISDVEGRHLFHRGTLCEGAVVQDCWVGLPDGDYMLRVGGNLLGDSGDHSWEFCGRSNGAAQEELQFKIKNGECIPLSHVSSAAICTVQDALIVGLGMITMSGSTVHSVVQLSENSDISLGNALSAALPGVVASSVTIVNIYYDADDDLTYLQFQASIHKGDLLASFYEMNGEDSEEMLRADAGSLLSLETVVDDSSFSAGFLYGVAIDDGNTFSRITSAHLTEFIVTSSAAVNSAVAPSPSPGLTSVKSEISVESSSTSSADVTALGQYAVGGTALLIVIYALYAVYSKIRKVKQSAAECDISMRDVGVFDCVDEPSAYSQVNADEEIGVHQKYRKYSKFSVKREAAC